MENMEIYCLMHSGKTLSSAAREVLLENAQWMRYEGNRKWSIQHPLCVGCIESDLESIDYLGREVVMFRALIDTPEGTTTVDYVVPVSNLDNICTPKMNWAKMSSDKNIPEELKNAAKRALAEMLEREGLDEDDYEIGDGVGVSMEGDGEGPLGIYTTDEEDGPRGHNAPFSNN